MSTVVRKNKPDRFLYHGKLLSLIKPDLSVGAHRWNGIVHITVRRDFGTRICQRSYFRLVGSASYHRVLASFKANTHHKVGSITVVRRPSTYVDNFGTRYVDGRPKGSVKTLLDAGGVGLSISQI